MEIIMIALGFLLVVGVLASWFTLRWWRMRRSGGVNVALRWHPSSVTGWHLGVGRYEGEQFSWYRVWSLRSGPDRIVSRFGLQITERREPSGAEAYTVPVGSTILRCELATKDIIEVAMAPGALTGFLSWLESAPPGSRLPHVR